MTLMLNSTNNAVEHSHHHHHQQQQSFSPMMMAPGGLNRMVRTVAGNCQETLELRRQLDLVQHRRAPHTPTKLSSFSRGNSISSKPISRGRFTINRVLVPENSSLLLHDNMSNTEADCDSYLEYYLPQAVQDNSSLHGLEAKPSRHTQVTSSSRANLLLSGLQTLIPGTADYDRLMSPVSVPASCNSSHEESSVPLLSLHNNQRERRNKPAKCTASSVFHTILVGTSLLFSLTGCLLVVFALVLDHSSTRLWNGITALLLGLQWASSGPYSLSLCSVRRMQKKHAKNQYAALKSPMDLLSTYHVANWLWPTPKWPIARTTLGLHTGLVACLLALTTMLLHSVEVCATPLDILSRSYAPINETQLDRKFSLRTRQVMQVVLVGYKCSYCLYSMASFLTNIIVLFGVFANLRALTIEIRRVSMLFLIDATIIERAEMAAACIKVHGDQTRQNIPVASNNNNENEDDDDNNNNETETKAKQESGAMVDARTSQNNANEDTIHHTGVFKEFLLENIDEEDTDSFDNEVRPSLSLRNRLHASMMPHHFSYQPHYHLSHQHQQPRQPRQQQDLQPFSATIHATTGAETARRLLRRNSSAHANLHVNNPPAKPPSDEEDDEQQQQQEEAAPGGVTTVDRFCEMSAAGARLADFRDLTMTEEEILRLHWCLQRRMNLVSNTIQRWFVCWTLFTVLWSLAYIIDWLKPGLPSQDASESVIWSSMIHGTIAVMLVTLPCLLIWLLVSAYAEVNAEVNNLLRAIYPLEGSRILFLRISMPIKGQQAWQVGLFGVPLTHGTAVTVIIALGITVAARILWAELARSLGPM